MIVAGEWSVELNSMGVRVVSFGEYVESIRAEAVSLATAAAAWPSIWAECLAGVAFPGEVKSRALLALLAAVFTPVCIV